MKSVAEIWQLIDAIAKPLPAAQRPLATSLGAVLAAPVHADTDQPAFDRSAIDGFALKIDSPPGSYRIVGSIEPGAESAVQPGPGEACRIFTGAEVPADSGLVMVEDSECSDNEVQTRQPARSKLIRRRGSSVRAGQCLLQAGTRIGPGEIAVLASVGAVHVEVIPPPRLLHLTTGSEIVPAEQSPQHGQIRNTNGPLIQALAQQAGSPIAANVHVDEQAQSLVKAVEAADPFDILLVSGGSSVGDHDHT
ncbi:MAG: molybdopterin molybdotransferase MoeA, partial [Opitutales bacterium]|nr:molybdopterin molybdotransferase MoeA [Opitutales bacterium]